MNPLHHPLSKSGLIAAAALGLSASLWAQTAPPPSSKAAVEAAYQRDRAACQALTAPLERSNCLRDVGAARAQASRSGARGGGTSPEQLQRNALLRCQQHPGEQERATCERMVRGEGTASGSVRGGGVIRELVTQEPLPPPPVGVPGSLPPLSVPPSSAPAMPLPAPMPPPPPAPMPR